MAANPNCDERGRRQVRDTNVTHTLKSLKGDIRTGAFSSKGEQGYELINTHAIRRDINLDCSSFRTTPPLDDDINTHARGQMWVELKLMEGKKAAVTGVSLHDI